MNSPLLIQATRGPRVESRHFVDALTLNVEGQVVESHGDPQVIVCPRSSLKPVQALPLLLSGAHATAPDELQGIAISCASHMARAMHVDFVREWLRRLQLSETDLACGVEPPNDYKRAREMVLAGREPSRVDNNCSGKHTGMLATCKKRGWDVVGYHKWDHPLQVMIRDVASELSGLDWHQLPYGLDGCSLPNYFLSLEKFGRMMTWFMSEDPHPWSEARSLILRAWETHPLMIDGYGELSSEITLETKGRLLAKIGAQGNFVCYDRARKHTTVLKVRDGLGRVAQVALLELLKKQGSLNENEWSRLSRFPPSEITNWAGEVAGHYQLAQNLES